MPARFVKEIVGYVDPLSVRAGDTLNVCISCDVPGEYDATLVRLISGDARPHGTGFREIEIDASLRGRYKAEQQPLLPGSYAVLPDLPATRCADGRVLPLSHAARIERPDGHSRRRRSRSA